MSTPAVKSRALPGWLILLGMLTAIGPLSIDMYLPSFPSIAASLGTEPARVELTLAVFLIGMALGQLAYGPLSDRFGRKPPLYVGLVLYVGASLMCALAPSVEWLTVGRFVQALGGSAGIVISRAVIRDRTTMLESAQAFSLLMLVMGLAPILAPLLGGAVLTWIGWRGIFGFLALVGGVLLIAVAATMRETVSRDEAQPLQLWRTLRTYGDLLRDRQLSGYALCGGTVFAGMFAYITGSPHVLIEVYGVPAEHFGWLFGLNAAGLIAASQLNARLLRRHSPETLLRRALWVPPIAGLVALVPVLLQIQTLPLLMLGLFGFVASLGFIAPNTTALALARGGRHSGSASALLGTLQFLLGTLGGVAVSVWHGGAGQPLAAIMVVCGVLGWMLYRFAARGAADTAAA